MKQISFDISFTRERKYTIHLANQDFLLFKSDTFVKKWLKDYKKIQLDNVKALNLFIPQIYTIYRLFYFEIDDKTNLKIQDLYTTINQRFDFIFKEYSKGNQNAFVFSNIEVILYNLSTVLEVLKEYANTHKNYSLNNQVKPLIKTLYQFEKQYYKDKSSLNIDNSYENKKVIKLAETKSKAL